jgi:hypothetical protein
MGVDEQGKRIKSNPLLPAAGVAPPNQVRPMRDDWNPALTNYYIFFLPAFLSYSIPHFRPSFPGLWKSWSSACYVWSATVASPRCGADWLFTWISK